MKAKAGIGTPGMRLSLSEMVSAFRWSSGDGCRHDLGDPCFQTIEEARRGGEFARRAVWAVTYRFTVPRTAELFDGMTATSVQFVRDKWSHTGRYDLDGALAALRLDRQNLARFRKRPVANAIADYLILFAADLDRVERTARDLAAYPADVWRPYPGYLNTGAAYGRIEQSDAPVLM